MDTRERILEATREVLATNGHTKLSMRDVAGQAGVSRPTLYRWFPSKGELLAAFGIYEQQKYDEGMATTLEGLTGLEALNAALGFIVEYQHTDPLARMVDVQPEHVLFQMTRTLPIMRRRIARLIPDGPDRDIIAATIVRIAISHYAMPADDQDDFLDQLRHAAGIVMV
jgi:AcrR family transcriptional regulator